MGAMLRQVPHQKAKNSTSCGFPAASFTVVGSVASSSVLTGFFAGVAVGASVGATAGASVAATPVGASCDVGCAATGLAVAIAA
jgi:hypothetical protein